MKIIKILIVNIILLALFIHIANYFVSINISQYAWFYSTHNRFKYIEYIKNLKRINNNYYITYPKVDIDVMMNDNYVVGDKLPTWQEFRPLENPNSNKSIIIFGCSFAQGWRLRNGETFSTLLGKQLPNYRIYNRSKDGWTTNHMLYQLLNKDFSEYKNVKYVIYVFIGDHIFRNYNSRLCATPYYKIGRNDSLSYQKYSLKYIKMPLINHLKILYHDNIEENSEISKSKIDLTKMEIKYARDVAEMTFPDSKFIVFRFDSGSEEPYNYMFENLKDNGVVVVNLNDFSDVQYPILQEYQISETDNHPNAKAWAEITPLFVKYLQDRGYFKD